WRFALRDVQGRYKGSYLGMLWSFITPLLMLSVYTFVFGVVLRTRLDWQTGNGSLEFSLIMFSGLIVFSVFSDCLARAPALIIGSPNYVKTVVFPLEVLPASVLVSSLIQAGISLAVLIAGSMVFIGRLSVTLVYFPIVLLLMLMFSLGLAWLLVYIGLFVFDISSAVSISFSMLISST